MKRVHVHVSVEDLDASARFYATVFGVPPTVRTTDHAKSDKYWTTAPPRLAWETFRSPDSIPLFEADTRRRPPKTGRRAAIRCRPRPACSSPGSRRLAVVPAEKMAPC